MTKTLLAFAAAALVATTGLAAANTQSDSGNYFAGGTGFDTIREPIVDLVIASSAGEVTLYDFDGKVQGQALATVPVMAGANTNLFDRFDLVTTPPGDVLAVLTVDGQVVAQQVYNRTDRS